MALDGFERGKDQIHSNGEIMKIRRIACLSLAIALAMMAYGCTQKASAPSVADVQSGVEQAQTLNVFKGKIVGRSNKARTISIEVGKGNDVKTVMLRFDDATTGLEHAAKGEAAIIAWEKRGSDMFATSVKPKLAKLPPGVQEITPEKVKQLVDLGKDFMLVDSRPASRYAQSHLPGAVSIPVNQMKSFLKSFPADKTKLLVFYCGGFT